MKESGNSESDLIFDTLVVTYDKFPELLLFQVEYTDIYLVSKAIHRYQGLIMKANAWSWEGQL